MSSISATGSGQRAYSIQAGGGQYTGVSLSPKAGDDATVGLFGLPSWEFTISLPSAFRIEKRVREDGAEFYVVVINQSSINLIGRNSPENNVTPGVAIRVQDEIEQQFSEKLRVESAAYIDDMAFKVDVDFDGSE